MCLLYLGAIPSNAFHQDLHAIAQAGVILSTPFACFTIPVIIVRDAEKGACINVLRPGPEV